MEKIYTAQIAFSSILIAFCIAMLSAYNDANTRAVYLPILTSVVGVWLPQPSSSKTNKSTEPIPLEEIKVDDQ